jgi:hypothetical protein
MRRRLLGYLAPVIFMLPGRITEASSIPLLNYEGGVLSQSVPQNLGFSIPQFLPMTLDYGPQGGTISFNAGTAGVSYPGLTSDSNQTVPINGQFGFNLGVPANGSSNTFAGPVDSFAGPVVEISGPLSGTLTGPGSGGTSWRWSGGFSGTATSAMLSPFNSQDTSALPAPLLDILNHPDHLHFSTFVTGGWANEYAATLTFDAPAPIPVPEPIALITLAVGVAAAIHSRRKGRAEKPVSLHIAEAAGV